MIYHPLQPPMLQSHLQNNHYYYEEYAPQPLLQSTVACYWSSTFQLSSTTLSTPFAYRIIPDGCIDIIFDLDALSVTQGAFVSSWMSTYDVFYPKQSMNFFGIRMYVEAVQAIVGYPIADLHGQIWLEELWGHSASYFWEQVVCASDNALRIDIIEQYLQQALYTYDIHPRPIHPLLSHSLPLMYACAGQIDLATLAQQVHYSERTVRRIFQQEFGIRPKEILDIIRFQSVLQKMYRYPQYSLGELAVSGGYYDQSHLIHDFHRYYGLTPGQLSIQVQSNSAL